MTEQEAMKGYRYSNFSNGHQGNIPYSWVNSVWVVRVQYLILNWKIIRMIFAMISLPVQMIVRSITDIDLHFWPFVMGIHCRPADSSHTEPVNTENVPMSWRHLESVTLHNVTSEVVFHHYERLAISFVISYNCIYLLYSARLASSKH